jgi:hypothetical protein
MLNHRTVRAREVGESCRSRIPRWTTALFSRQKLSDRAVERYACARCFWPLDISDVFFSWCLHWGECLVPVSFRSERSPSALAVRSRQFIGRCQRLGRPSLELRMPASVDQVCFHSTCLSIQAACGFFFAVARAAVEEVGGPHAQIGLTVERFHG